MTDGVSRSAPARSQLPDARKPSTPGNPTEVAAAAAQFSSLMDDQQQPIDSDDAGASAADDESAPAPQSESKSTPQERPARGRDRSSSEQGSDAKTKGDTPERQNLSPGDAILQSLAGQQQQPDAGLPLQAQARGSADAAQALDQIAQQVASQVLVSDPSTSGAPEVRITLNESVLPGTEIRISETAGRLEVQFVTTSSDSQALLSQNQGALQNRLTERLGQRDVVVSVNPGGGETDEPPDGRSRQQRSVVDEYDPDD